MQNSFGGAKPKQHKTSLRIDDKRNYNDSSWWPKHYCAPVPPTIEPDQSKTNSVKKRQMKHNKNITTTKNGVSHNQSSTNFSQKVHQTKQNLNPSKELKTSSVKFNATALTGPPVQANGITSSFPVPNNKIYYKTYSHKFFQSCSTVGEIQLPANGLYCVESSGLPHCSPGHIQNAVLLSGYERLNNVKLSLLEKHKEQIKIKEKEIAHSNDDDKEILKIHLSMLDKKKNIYIEQMESIFQRLKIEPTQLNLVQEEFRKNNTALKEKHWLSAYRNDILQALASSQVLIISGERGYGKSTLIPLYASEMCSKMGTIASCQSFHVSVITLANHLANLVEIDLGKTVGYNLGKDKTASSGTNILFTTYHILLKESLNSPFLSHYSCIILDDCHDRSVEADIFLCKAKEILQQRPNFKLILISSYPDDRFEKFFTSGEKIAVISLPNISFPVDVFWNTLRNPNLYVERAVELVTSIHRNKKHGNVVVFLPTVQETQKACALIETQLLNEVLCFSFHSKTTIDEVNKMFSLDTKRKVIFSTECAESSISLPDVHFVIDSGKVKEKVYNTDKCQSIISTHFISKERAKRRRQLAGHVKGGRCYCLYTESIYSTEMPEKSHLLISKLNPANLVLTLLYYKIDNPFNINFICTLERKVLETGALELKKYGAVKDEMLTKLGKTMAVMPFELRHAKLATLGMENGFSFETIVIALLASLSMPIFNTVGTSKDIGKNNFFDPDGDYFAIFDVYLKWKSQNFSKEWCQKNGINHSSLISLHNKLTETGAVLNIKSCHPNTIASREKLIKLICNCFCENLCVYTGHFRLGYKLLNTGDSLRIHSSSTFSYKSDTPPQYIVYDYAIDHGNFGFMVNITPVPTEIVNTILKDYSTSKDKKAIWDDQMDFTIIEPVGEMFIKQEMLGKQGKKLKGLEDTIKKNVDCNSIIIDPNAESGRIEIYAPAQYLKPAKDSLTKHLEVYLEKLRCQEEETCMPTGNVLMKLSWGQGGVITKVSGTVSKECFHEKILNEHESVCSILHNYGINLTWRRRLCKGMGFVTFNSAEDFSRAFSSLSSRELSIHGKDIKVSASRKAPNQLYVEDLLPRTSNEDLKEAIENHTDFKVKSATIVYTPPFSTTQEDIEIIKQTLLLQFVRYVEHGNLNIHIETPNSTDTIMKAHLNFDAYADISVILNAVERDGINQFQDIPLSYKQVYRTTIICVPDHYESVKRIMEAEISRFNFSGIPTNKFKFNESLVSSGIQLKLLTNDYGVMQKLEKIVMTSLEGQKLEGFTVHQLRKLFSHSGQQWLKQIEKATQCYIVKNFKQKTLCVCGTSERYHKIMHKIKEYLNNMEKEIVSVIKLGEKNFSRQVIKSLVTKYGIKLEKFIIECELISVEFNVQYGQLTLYGTSDSIKKAEEALKSLASQSQTLLLTDKNEEVCPVCLTVPSTGSSHRLEYCGHLYCSDCSRLLVAEKSIPLKCCKHGCNKEFVIEDILDILEGNEEETQKLLYHSLNVYVEKNYNHIKLCPTPDCNMIYDLHLLPSVENSDLWKCPACMKVVCIRCNIVEHPGMSCDTAKKMKEDEDYSLKVWMANNLESRKHCPKCNSPIEKTGGCNHMTCRKCQAHLCWLCLQVFRDGSSVYNHLPYCSRNQTPYT